MPRSRSKPKAKAIAPARGRRWDWRRVAAGLAELLRNLALIVSGTPFLEPLLRGAPIDVARAVPAIFWGVFLVTISVIVDHERRD